MLTYNLKELHLIPKILGSQHNNADQLSIQFVTSLQVIPAKSISVDCIQPKNVNQEVNFYFWRKSKTAISPPIFCLYQFFFQKLEIIL